MNKVRLVGSGVTEMPQDGRRFRFHVDRYRHDDGTEWGVITKMEEIPDTGEYLLIPSYGVETADELQHMRDEYEYEKANPTAERQEWDGQHTERKQQLMESYDELRDHRAELIRRSPRTLRGR